MQKISEENIPLNWIYLFFAFFSAVNNTNDFGYQ